LNKARRCVEPFLKAAFAASSLATLEGKLRYIPIVMPEGMRQRYPARSELRKKERIYVCAPQLNYDVFVEGNFEDQLRDYCAVLPNRRRILPALAPHRNRSMTSTRSWRPRLGVFWPNVRIRLATDLLLPRQQPQTRAKMTDRVFLYALFASGGHTNPAKLAKRA
jgi:hypothetical protein